MRIFRKLQKADDLVADGIRRRATVTKAELLNRGEFQVSGKRAEAMLAGEATMITMRLELDVASDQGEPTRVKLKSPVPMMLSTRVAIGTELEVLVDPSDARKVAIDWDAPIAEPSLEERAEHDPMLKELLDRRVDPPASD